jgi:hypothetical protein
LAIGQHGCEYFYDAANPTASPLARQEGASLPFGCNLPASICTNKNTVVMLANNNDGGVSLKLIEDFKHKDIPAPVPLSAINYLVDTASLTADDIRTFFFRHKGELLFAINLIRMQGSCWAYHFDSGIWIELTRGHLSGSVGGQGEWYFPVQFTAAATTGTLGTFVQGMVQHDNAANGSKCFVGQWGSMSPGATLALDYFNSFGITTWAWEIPITVKTPRLDFGTMNAKTMARLGVNVDWPGAVSDDSAIILQYTDNNYVSYTSREIFPNDTALGFDANFPFATQMGQFRTRAIFLKYKGSWPLRLYYMEVDINRGQQ